MQREIKQELVSFWIVFLQQIGMPKWIIRRAMGITPLAMHILTERAKVNRKLWLQVMWHDNWTCYLCGQGRRANDPFELEHKQALFNWGKTTLDNLGCAHKSCNRRKGTKLLDDQALYPTLNRAYTQTKAIIVILIITLVLFLFIFRMLFVH